MIKLSDHKTLIGKNNYLFLINDSCKELEVHCNNLNLVNKHNLSRYNLNNFLLIVIPNKSLIYKDYLPEEYIVKYRTGLQSYIEYFGEKLIDTYHTLNNETDTYYKTDSHINMKGSYLVYKYFINKINEIYNLNVTPREVNILSKECVLTNLKHGLGDLLWKTNLGDQNINDNKDVFYYSEDVNYIYYNHKINKDDSLRILNKDLKDINHENEGSLISWEILSNNILYKKNVSKNKTKVLIFYDSFLISLLDLYLELFEEVYMIKEIYNNRFIDAINPDFVFEFRVERFLF